MFTLKAKIFSQAVNLACNAFDLCEEQLFRSRTMCAVDARYCLICALSGLLSDIEIAQSLGKTRQAINHLKNNRSLDTAINRYAIKQIASKLKTQL